jgi:cellulose synthase/poly-beta-1,6-N-acetylglucosamine synthase-like glycosyltransferase
VLEVLVLSLYSVAMVLLGVFAFAQLDLALRRRRARRAPRIEPASLAGDELPFVTVQLPIYNELHVATRLLEHVAALDYPRHRFEIHVLDDSTDETRGVLDEEVARLRTRGVPIRIIRREQRFGFKAGALRDALVESRGEFIAIFDADFMPRPDFLRVLLPHFCDSAVAVVQARWGYLNERQTLLTRIQAFFLDVHFTAEQTGRSKAGLFANFNGTAGMWRRIAIDDAGGWRADTLTEDVDLSYRAQLRGWKIRYLEEYLAPSELPVDAQGFRSQQFRWIKGGAENARLHLGDILRAPLPWRVKLHASEHLLATSVYVVLLSAILLSVPLSFLKNTFIQLDYVHFGMIFFTSTLALSYVYYDSRGDEVATWAGKLRFVPMMAVFLVFTMGLALHNGLAALRGWWGERSDFERTPKYGRLASARHFVRSAYAERRLPRGVFGELALAAYVMLGIMQGIRTEDFGLLPLQTMAFLGLAALVGLSVVDHRLARRSASSRIDQTAPAARSSGGASSTNASQVMT